MIVVALVATLLTYATGFRVNYCGGCTESLFRGRSNDNDIEVTVDDVGRIIASHIDEMALTDELKETVPDLSHLDEIFFTPTLDTDMFMERVKMAIHTIVDNAVAPTEVERSPKLDDPTCQDDRAIKHKDVTSGITTHVLQVLGRALNERNKLLVERREIRLKQLTQSIINDMWSITSDKIRESLDTQNVSETEYRQMVRELLPELSAATNHSGVQKVLLFPVISDELNLIISKSNDTGTVQDLTDKMFIKLVPFIREGLLKDISQIETPDLEEDAINEIEDILGPQLEMATKNGLVVAGKLQNALNQELKDHSIAMNYIEEVKPLIKSGVEETMKKLQDRGISHKGRINDALLVRYILWRSHYEQSQNLRKSYGLDEFAKKFQTLIGSEKSLPEISALRTFRHNLIDPKMKELVLKNVEEFRRKNPQLSKCGESILAARVVGAIKSRVKSLTKEYLTSMKDSSSNDKMDEQAVVNYVMEILKELLPQLIEEEAEESGDFESGKFKESNTYEDVKLQVQSSIHSVVMRELNNMEK